MENFTFHNPTRIHFGRGQIAALDAELPADARILLLAGGGSIRRNGVLEQVRRALGSRHVVEFFGVEPNPDYDTLMRAVAAMRSDGLDWVLPVGGGSVLDGAKFVAAAVRHDGEPWDILARGAPVRAALPIGAVLTLPATGSEANGAAVISRRALREKLAFISPLVFPRFSILDPETTFSLPPEQVANGVADAFTHVIEQYLTYPVDAAVQDRLAEAVLQVLIEVGPRTLAEPRDYAARANFMWAATWALNTALSAGVPGDWATHMIGHELTALYGLDHARTLAVVLPSLLQVQRATKREKLLQYGARVWGITAGDPESRITAAIERTAAFYRSLGIGTRLGDYGIPAEPTASEVARRLAARGMTPLGERGDLTPERIAGLLREAA